MGFWIFFIIILFLCFGPLNIGGIRHRKIMKLVGCGFLIFITILRFDVGYDYSGYFQAVYPNIDIVEYERVEPANKYIYDFVSQQKFPPLLFMIYGTITFLLLFYSFNNYTKNFSIAIFVYIAFFYLGGLSTIRQEIAVSITLFAYKYIEHKKFLLYFLMCSIALLFHDTAFVAIMIYPFLRIKNHKVSIMTAIIIILSLFLFINILFSLPVLSPFLFYFENLDDFQGGNITKIAYLSISILMLVLSLKKRETILVNMSLLCIIGTTLMYILGGHVGGRIAEYFIIYLCLLIPNILIYFKRYTINITCALMAWFIAGIYISMQIPQKSPNTPYQTILTVDLKNPHFK